MNRTFANTVLALNFACLSLALNGCQQQQPQAQPQPEITVEVRVPPPTIITREIYLPAEKTVVSEKETEPTTQHICEKDKDKEKDKDLPSAPETSKTTEEQEVETPEVAQDKPKNDKPAVVSKEPTPKSTSTPVTDTLVVEKPAETAQALPNSNLQ